MVYFKTKLGKLYHGKCLEVLKAGPSNSVDSIVTDPPYGLKFMGKKWDYNVPGVDVWKECLRVLKPGGFLLSFAGTRTQHRMAVNIEDAGFEIRDMIAWVYGSGFPKSLDIGKAVDKLQRNERKKGELKFKGGTQLGMINDDGWKPKDVYVTEGNSDYEGWGTALKPALEPITVARKPLSEPTVAKNVLKWGTGGINIDGSRVEGTPESTRFDPEKHSHDGYRMNQTGMETANTASKKQGRFPANFIHDGSDEVVGLFPETGKSSGGRIGKKGNSAVNIVPAGQYEKGDPGFGDSGSAARFFYCAKASKKERNMGCEGLELKDNLGYEVNPDNPYKSGHRNDNNTDQLYMGITGKAPTKKHNYHPTVKPLALMKYLVTLVTPKSGTVLDPFMGSGTTGIVCEDLGFNWIGIEMEEDYCEIASKRIQSKINQLGLF